MEALVFGSADVVGTEDREQCIAVVGHDTSPVYQTHAIRRRPARCGIVYPLAELSNRRGRGQVCKLHAALNLSRRRQDPEVDCEGRLLGHGRRRAVPRVC